MQLMMKEFLINSFSSGFCRLTHLTMPILKGKCLFRNRVKFTYTSMQIISFNLQLLDTFLSSLLLLLLLLSLSL